MKFQWPAEVILTFCSPSVPGASTTDVTRGDRPGVPFRQLPQLVEDIGLVGKIHDFYDYTDGAATKHCCLLPAGQCWRDAGGLYKYQIWALIKNGGNLNELGIDMYYNRGQNDPYSSVLNPSSQHNQHSSHPPHSSFEHPDLLQHHSLQGDSACSSHQWGYQDYPAHPPHTNQ